MLWEGGGGGGGEGGGGGGGGRCRGGGPGPLCQLDPMDYFFRCFTERVENQRTSAFQRRRKNTHTQKPTKAVKTFGPSVGVENAKQIGGIFPTMLRLEKQKCRWGCLGLPLSRLPPSAVCCGWGE